MDKTKINILIAGWFSFENGHATAGDILSCETVCLWLDHSAIKYDVAFDLPFHGGVDWRKVNPEQYTHVIFVCGPFEKGQLETEFLTKFGSKCRLIGLNLSMKIPINEWNPFDLLIERNSSININPDLVFAAKQNIAPVIGVCLVEDYEGAMVKEANNIISEFLKGLPAAIIYIDTRLDVNTSGLRSPAEIETIISRVDFLITTRLHGTVLALKNGIPVIAIDPEFGGSKIRKQCELLGWHSVINVNELSIAKLHEKMHYCISPKAKTDALECANNAYQNVELLKNIFIDSLLNSRTIDDSFNKRTSVSDNCEPLSIQEDHIKRNKISTFILTAIRNVFQ